MQIGVGYAFDMQILAGVEALRDFVKQKAYYVPN